MLTILFIVGRTTLFTPVDINQEQVEQCCNNMLTVLFILGRTRGGLVSIPQCIAVLDHCIDIINSPARLAQCSLAVVVKTHLTKSIVLENGAYFSLLVWD